MKCKDCDRYSNNQTGCWSKGICLADMMDGKTAHWNVKREPDHECHRGKDGQRV